MCGLFGWNVQPEIVSRHRASMRALAITLMLKNDERGGDSWGFYGVRDGLKRVGIGETVTMSRKALRSLCRQESVIGHTRKATAGGICLANCHPFDFGNTVGAHNGIVYNHYELNKEYNRVCEVDSEHIFAHLEDELPLNDIEAYGAIAFHNRQTPEYPIYLSRFNGGELSVVQVQGVGTIFSSDEEHLEQAVHLAGWEIKTTWKIDPNKFYGLTDDYRVLVLGDCDVGEPVYVSRSDKEATGSRSDKGYYSQFYNKDEDVYDWRYSSRDTSSDSNSQPADFSSTPENDETMLSAEELALVNADLDVDGQDDSKPIPLPASAASDTQTPNYHILTAEDILNEQAKEYNDRDWSKVMGVGG